MIAPLLTQITRFGRALQSGLGVFTSANSNQVRPGPDGYQTIPPPACETLSEASMIAAHSVRFSDPPVTASDPTDAAPMDKTCPAIKITRKEDPTDAAPNPSPAIPAGTLVPKDNLSNFLIHNFWVCYNGYQDASNDEGRLLTFMCARGNPEALHLNHLVSEYGTLLTQYEQLEMAHPEGYESEKLALVDTITGKHNEVMQAPFRKHFMDTYYEKIKQEAKRLRPIDNALATIQIRTARGENPMRYRLHYHPEYTKGGGEFVTLEISVHSEAQVVQVSTELEMRGSIIIDRRSSTLLLYNASMENLGRPEARAVALRKLLLEGVEQKLSTHADFPVLKTRLKIFGTIQDNSGGANHDALFDAAGKMLATLEEAHAQEVLAKDLLYQLDDAIVSYGEKSEVVSKIPLTIEIHREQAAGRLVSMSR